jgi:hypothetical protein
MPRALIHPRALQAARPGLEDPLARLTGAQAVATSVQQGAVEPGVRQGEAERIGPIQAAADRLGCRAIGAPCNGLPHHEQRQAPGRAVHGPPGGRRPLGNELIVIAGAELGAQGDGAVAFGERGRHRGHCRLWDRR